MKKLTSVQDAIEQAKSQGWDFELDVREAFTNPLFWQALGKARGWEVTKEWYCEEKDCSFRKTYFSHHDHTFCPRDGKKLKIRTEDTGASLRRAYDWFENRMVGGSEEEFWKSLP